MDRNELRRLLLFAAAVLVLFFLARIYAPAFDAAFIWDDHTLVEGNASYREAGLGEILTRPFWPETPFTDARTPYFRPIVMLSYRFDIALGGTPREFHFTNIALHLVTCLLLGIVAVRAGASYPGAVIASLCWGALPRLTEAVAWIAGRTDVLAACFGFAALAAWPETGPPPWRRAWARSSLAGFFLFLSFASKEVGLAFGIAIVVIVVLRKGGREVLVRTGVCVGAPLIVYLALRAAAFARIDVPPARELGFGRRVATVLEAAGRYAEATVDPFHPRTSIGMIGEPDTAYVVAGAIALIAGAGLAYYVVRRGSFGARLGLVLGAAAIFPVLQIIPLVLTSAVVADRLLYVPLAGLALLFAVALSHRGLRVVGGAAIVLALALGFSTSARAADYTNETKFWVIAAENAHPHNASPRMALARWLLDSGEPEPACKLLERATAMLSAEGLTSRPPYRRAREGLAACWVRIGRYDDALRMDRELARELPDHARVALELGYAELHVRDFDAARAAFARAAKLENRPAEGYVVSPARIAAIEQEDAAFDTLTPHERAQHLAGLGRAREASKAFLDIALAHENDATEDDRYDAANYLMMHGDYPDAALAVERVPPPSQSVPPRAYDMRAEYHWRRRLRVHQAVLALAPRIDALGR